MVNYSIKILAVAFVVGVMLLPAVSAAADESVILAVPEVEVDSGFAEMFGVLGGLLASGIIVFGAAIGIGRIAGSATEAIARQPEAGGRIFTSMVIAASLIEGIAFFGLIVCFVTIFRLT